MTITNNDLVALLNDARQELAVLASHLDHPDVVWPTLGLKTTAKAHKRLVERIDAWMAEPVEELPLRQENFALRAALAVRHNDEDWRLKYLEAERERVKLAIRVRALEWNMEAACENTPTATCECPGCGTARERALRGEA